MSCQVTLTIEQHIATLCFSNPDYQYMTVELLEQIQQAFITAENDPQVRVIVLKNQQPGYFITHYSLDEINQVLELPMKLKPWLKRWFPATLRLSMALSRQLIHLDHWASTQRLLDKLTNNTLLQGTITYARVNRFLLRLRQSQKPVIAMLAGNTQGYGMELALACDFRLMARGDYHLGQIESLIGLIPGSGGMHHLARLTGTAKAMELSMLGTRLKADDAEQLGLIYKACDEDVLEQECYQLAQQLCLRSPLSLSYIKRNINRGRSLDFAQAIKMDEVGFMDSACTPQASDTYQQQQQRLNQGESINNSFEHWQQTDLNQTVK
ncbi:enoyl-CoA hydratase/isomerase family protein [Bacterioplanoides sp.]|uniref:enoyl-CoA hydratase/isomerase family protein n=1 Tax=Bacterioplanoides sp. TaxID=2066072 RepID=UPI003B006D58